MTDETQAQPSAEDEEAQSSSEEEQAQLSPQDEQKIESFLSEFAKFSEPDDPSEAQDYLDIGVPTAVENVKAAQSDAESAAGAESGAAETETAEPEEPESLGATMTQDQLDALFAGDVVAAFAKPDEDETKESPDEVDQDPESAGDAGEPEEEVLEETEPALAAAEDQPAEEESNHVGDPEEEVTPISAEETPITDALEDIESGSTEVETPPEEVVTEPEMDILEELSAEADDDKIEPLELTDDDLASLLDDGGGGTEPEVAAAPTADAPSVPDLSQDEINSLFGAPADSQDAPTGSAELSQADIDALLPVPPTKKKPRSPNLKRWWRSWRSPTRS
jgi:hypothetical protein